MILASEDDRYPVIQVHNSFIIKDRFRKKKAPPRVLTFFCTLCKKSLKLLSTIDHVTTVKPPLMATSLQRPLNFVPADSPYTDWLLFQPVYNGHWSVSPTAKITSRQQPVFFRGRWKCQEWSWNFIRMVCWWLIAAILFWFCFIYATAVSINCQRYL